MNKRICGIVLAAVACTAFGVNAAEKKESKPDAEENLAALRAAVAEDLSHEVRPGGVNGQPFWNKNAVWFLYPPAFDFPEVERAREYRFRVFDRNGKVHDFRAKSPKASLAPVWKNLPVGKVDV